MYTGNKFHDYQDLFLFFCLIIQQNLRYQIWVFLLSVPPSQYNLNNQYKNTNDMNYINKGKCYHYLTPRMIIANSVEKLNQEKDKLLQTHKGYLHIFNLTKQKVAWLPQNQYKWRGLPYSISETIKILCQMDLFYRKNLSNTAIILTSNQITQDYGYFLALAYTRVCEMSSNQCFKLSKKIKFIQPFALTQFQTAYQTNKISHPPLRIIQQIKIQSLNNSSPFIPVFQVFTEGRYNDLQLVYTHNICDQLQTLQSGFGIRYDDQKPETTYLKVPVTIFGDCMITIYSFETLKLQKRCIIGFNTYNLPQKEYFVISPDDFYQGKGDFNVLIKFSKTCERKQCFNESRCSQCKQNSKKISARYKEAQQYLEKLNRKRNIVQAKQLLSL